MPGSGTAPAWDIPGAKVSYLAAHEDPQQPRPPTRATGPARSDHPARLTIDLPGARRPPTVPSCPTPRPTRRTSRRARPGQWQRGCTDGCRGALRAAEQDRPTRAGASRGAGEHPAVAPALTQTLRPLPLLLRSQLMEADVPSSGVVAVLRLEGLTAEEIDGLLNNGDAVALRERAQKIADQVPPVTAGPLTERDRKYRDAAAELFRLADQAPHL